MTLYAQVSCFVGDQLTVKLNVMVAEGLVASELLTVKASTVTV